MYWHSAYSETNTLESTRKDFEDICKMRDEYSDQITKISDKIKELNKDGIFGCNDRIRCLEDMRGNLLFSYKGIMSNYRAIKNRLDRLESAVYDTNSNNETRYSSKT